MAQILWPQLPTPTHLSGSVGYAIYFAVAWDGKPNVMTLWDHDCKSCSLTYHALKLDEDNNDDEDEDDKNI